MADLPDILQRTASQWVAVNPFLPKGMLAIESDTGRKKYGTGQRYLATAYVPDETTAELPPSATSGDVLMYTSGAWSAASLDVGDVSGLQDVLDGKQDELAAGTEGQVLTYVSGEWVAAAPTGGGNGLPSGNSNGDLLKYQDGSWIAAAPTFIPLPFEPNANTILSWNGSAWIAVSPSTPGLPSGTTYDLLVYDGTDWVSEPLYGGSYSPLAAGASEGDFLSWDATSGDWIARTLTQVLPTANGDGHVLAWNSGASAWVAAEPVKELPESPGDGKILTYSASASAWIASDQERYKLLTSDETTNSIESASSLSLTLASGCDYVVEGMAVISNNAGDEYIYFGLRLLAMDEDGEVYLEYDYITADTGNIYRGQLLVDQSMTAVISAASADVQYRVPFRALVRVSPSVSSTDIKVWYGGTGGDATIHGGSWMSARRVTLDN